MERDCGIIMRLTKLSETSLIVQWCTRESGVIKTVAKGARSAKSGFAGQLDLFVEGELVWAPSRSSELHGLRELQPLVRRKLGENYAKTYVAAHFCTLIERVVEPHAPVPELYDLLKGALDYLCETTPSQRIVQHFEKRLASELGLLREGQSPRRALEDHSGRRIDFTLELPPQ